MWGPNAAPSANPSLLEKSFKVFGQGWSFYEFITDHHSSSGVLHFCPSYQDLWCRIHFKMNGPPAMGGGSRTAATVERCGAGPDGGDGGGGPEPTGLILKEWADVSGMWANVKWIKMECRKLRKIHVRTRNCQQLSLCGCSFCEMTECSWGNSGNMWKYWQDRSGFVPKDKAYMSSDQLQLWSRSQLRILPGAETSQTQELQARQRTPELRQEGPKKPQTSQLGCWSGCVGTLVASCRLTSRL